jgi:2-(1,2-epoxy-1,2-dihydrophenyl)acetyl-CoA isomerase
VKIIDSGPVLLDLDDDGIAHLQLDRPETFNATDEPLTRALHEAVAAANRERGLRVLLLTGAGANFSVGADFEYLPSHPAAFAKDVHEVGRWANAAVRGLLALEAPVIAAVHGYAGGRGLALACAADLVIASESAKFVVDSTRVGSAPDSGVSVMLPQLVGLRKALELVLTAPTLSADEALKIGLITRVVPDTDLEEDAWALARTLACGPPLALAAAKRLLWSGLGRQVEAQMPDEVRAVIELSHTGDGREAVAALVERRRPSFVGA